jgi:hypothetical protein
VGLNNFVREMLSRTEPHFAQTCPVASSKKDTGDLADQLYVASNEKDAESILYFG